jgi:hypothetical protein
MHYLSPSEYSLNKFDKSNNLRKEKKEKKAYKKKIVVVSPKLSRHTQKPENGFRLFAS